MSKFNIGDTVVVTPSMSKYYGMCGVIVDVFDNTVSVKMRNENLPLWFWNHEAEVIVKAIVEEPKKPLTIHYNTAQYKAAVWHVYKKNFTEQGGAVFANYLEAQDRLDRLIVDATKSGMVATAGFLVTADKAGENEYYVDVYVQPCFGEYHSSTTLEIVQ